MLEGSRCAPLRVGVGVIVRVLCVGVGTVVGVGLAKLLFGLSWLLGVWDNLLFRVGCLEMMVCGWPVWLVVCCCFFGCLCCLRTV